MFVRLFDPLGYPRREASRSNWVGLSESGRTNVHRPAKCDSIICWINSVWNFHIAHVTHINVKIAFYGRTKNTYANCLPINSVFASIWRISKWFVNSTKLQNGPLIDVALTTAWLSYPATKHVNSLPNYWLNWSVINYNDEVSNRSLS